MPTHWNTCESPHSSTGVDNAQLSVQIQQGPVQWTHCGEWEKGFKEQLRECWMTHKDQICSLQNTLLVHAVRKEIFFMKKTTAKPMPLKSSKKPVQETG